MSLFKEYDVLAGSKMCNDFIKHFQNKAKEEGNSFITIVFNDIPLHFSIFDNPDDIIEHYHKMYDSVQKAFKEIDRIHIENILKEKKEDDKQKAIITNNLLLSQLKQINPLNFEDIKKFLLFNIESIGDIFGNKNQKFLSQFIAEFLEILKSRNDRFAFCALDEFVRRRFDKAIKMSENVYISQYNKSSDYDDQLLEIMNPIFEAAKQIILGKN